MSHERAVDPQLGVVDALVRSIDNLDRAISLVDQRRDPQVIGRLLRGILALRREGGQLSFLRVITLEGVLHLSVGAASDENESTECDCGCAKHKGLLSGIQSRREFTNNCRACDVNSVPSVRRANNQIARLKQFFRPAVKSLCRTCRWLN